MIVDKRVVMVTVTGAQAGMWRILGTESQLREALCGVPTLLPMADFQTHRGAASLVTVKPRYILYREVIVPQGYATMHPAQV